MLCYIFDVYVYLHHAWRDELQKLTKEKFPISIFKWCVCTHELT